MPVRRGHYPPPNVVGAMAVVAVLGAVVAALPSRQASRRRRSYHGCTPKRIEARVSGRTRVLFREGCDVSNDQNSTPTEPYIAWQHSQGQSIQPYSHPGPPPTPYGPTTGLPVGGAYSHSSVVAPRVGSVHIAVAWVFAVLTIGYFLPWAIAASRQKSNTLAIALLNFLVGWTIIGWIAALVMSVQNEPTQVTNVAYAVAPVVHLGSQAVPSGWYPDHLGVRRYWDGQRWTEHTAP